MGKIKHSDLDHYFNASDIFVLNSGYEGLSHVLIEALNYGLPIIASDKGGNKEVIKENFNGLLVKYNDKEEWKKAILNLINNRKLRLKFIKNSQIDLKRFDYSFMFNKTKEIFEKI